MAVDKGREQPKAVKTPRRSKTKTMTKASGSGSVSAPARPRSFASYYPLVNMFPLVPIRDDAHLSQALAVVEELLTRDLDEGADAYLNVLTSLIESYESRVFPMPDISEADVLRELMRQNSLSQSALEEKVGIAQPTLSAVLRGSRKLTREQVVTLARFFHVSPAVFLKAT
jgi:HTH-type transcriptional regulator/antitoxin HigA